MMNPSLLNFNKIIRQTGQGYRFRRPFKDILPFSFLIINNARPWGTENFMYTQRSLT